MATEIRVDQRLTITPPGPTEQGAERDEFRLISFPTTFATGTGQMVETATPPEIYLGALPGPELRLRTPLRLEVQREDDSVVVWSADLDEFGYGPHLTAAIEDFQQTIIELYHTLEGEQDRLGPGMVELWGVLQQTIERRP